MRDFLDVLCYIDHVCKCAMLDLYCFKNLIHSILLKRDDWGQVLLRNIFFNFKHSP